MTTHDFVSALEHQPYRISVPLTFGLCALSVFTKITLFLFSFMYVPSAETVRQIQFYAGILTIIVAAFTICGIVLKWVKKFKK